MSRSKRFLFYGILLALLLGFVEVASWLILRGVEGGPVSRRSLAEQRKAIIRDREFAFLEIDESAQEGEDAAPQLQFLRNEILHPYLGFVLNHETNTRNAIRSWQGRRITRHGFIGEPGLFPETADGSAAASIAAREEREAIERARRDERRAENRGEADAGGGATDAGAAEVGEGDPVVIGVFGGSVAFFFSFEGVESLIEQLRTHPEYAGRPFEVVRICLGGYKQPQQLLALQWFLAQGARFDIVLNIDGFNEVALSLSENFVDEVHPFLPRRWRWRLSDPPDPMHQRLLGEAVYLSSTRRRLAKSFSKPIFASTFTGNLLWKVRDRMASQKAWRAQQKLEEYGRREPTKVAQRGPHDPSMTIEEAKRQTIDLWRRSSVLMHRACEAGGMRYVHVLQPNQYVEGSKPIGPEESKVAIHRNSLYGPPVELAYDDLRAAGATLADDGVAYLDATMIFAGIEEPLYIDTCCHFNTAGNLVLADEIARFMLDRL